jgi:hypothetical protein
MVLGMVETDQRPGQRCGGVDRQAQFFGGAGALVSGEFPNALHKRSRASTAAPRITGPSTDVGAMTTRKPASGSRCLQVVEQPCDEKQLVVMVFHLGIAGTRARRVALLVPMGGGLGDRRALMMELVQHHPDLARAEANGEHPRRTRADDLHRHWDSFDRPLSN